MMNLKVGIIGGAFAFAVSFMTGSAVTAATCATGTVTPSSTCQIGSTNNDFIGQDLQVNQDSMFGKTDWIYAGKFEVPSTYEDGAVDIGFAVSGLTTGGAGGGDWNVNTNTFDIYAHLMIVLKGPNGGPNVGNYIGFLIDSGETSGTFNGAFNNSVSHITAYVQGTGGGTPPPIPLPAAAWLLLSGIGGLGVMGWRKRRATV